MPQAAQSELACERSTKDEAVARASKAEREVDQAKARGAVLDNKVAVSIVFLTEEKKHSLLPAEKIMTLLES